MIWITGAEGMLGSCLAPLFKEKGISALTSDAEVDITDAAAIDSFAASRPIQTIINCAAFTNVPACETHYETARKINADGPRNLAAFAARKNALLVHVSTDYVFDGNASAPYSEEDKTNPQSVYGESKLAGEQAVLKYAKTAIIIRTSWLYCAFGKNFLKTVMRTCKDKGKMSVVSDQTGTPTYAGDLAKAISKVLPQIKEGEKDIYHFSNTGSCSWYDFAREIAGQLGLDCSVNPIGTKDYPTPAKRPVYSVLSKEKIKRRFNLEIRDWKEGVKECLKQIS